MTLTCREGGGGELRGRRGGEGKREGRSEGIDVCGVLVGAPRAQDMTGKAASKRNWTV